MFVKLSKHDKKSFFEFFYENCKTDQNSNLIFMNDDVKKQLNFLYRFIKKFSHKNVIMIVANENHIRLND